MDLHFILAIFNIHGRLSSQAGYKLGSWHQMIITRNFEPRIYIHVNREHWDISGVNFPEVKWVTEVKP